MSKALITITTCNRLQEVQKYVWGYLEFCDRNENFDFLLAQDGNAPDYKVFSEKFEIPMLYSDECEGVGLSKNRVLEKFPDYDHYFFLDDDVELYDSTVFDVVISAARDLKLDHLCITPFKAPSNIFKAGNFTIEQGNKGGGYFNYFTRKGLKKVGGWHTEFAKWKRYGHTEHTLRFVHNKLSEYGFTSVKEATKMVILHDPPHVTEPIDSHGVSEISDIEQKIIDQKLEHFPVTTLCLFRFNEFAMNSFPKAMQFREIQPKRYPFLEGKRRREALSEFYFFKFENSTGISKLNYFFGTIFTNWKNPKFKHWVKSKIGRT